jgi:hypothetical protein
VSRAVNTRFAARSLLALLLLGVGLLPLAPPSPAEADTLQSGAGFFINTTADLVLEPQLCLPGQPCTFRSAIDKAQSFRAAVRVCFENNCPPGKQPLKTDDPLYDPQTGRWTLQINANLQSLLVYKDGIDVDFTKFVDGWRGPQDNRIVLSSGGDLMNHLIMIEGSDNKFAGFEIRGRFQDAAIIMRKIATGNQLGPGMAFAGIQEGNGVRILGATSTGNRIVGSWCGFTIDASRQPVLDGLVEDCVHIAEGSSENVIGGPNPADRNVLSGSQLGFGVALHDAATRNNVVQGNYIGTDVTGLKAVGNDSGVAIFDEASGTKVIGNVISGNRNAGLTATNASTQFGRSTSLIENNIIGADASGNKALPNGTYGVEIRGLSKDMEIAHNHIMFNRSGGVVICDSQTHNNTITENSITDNSGTAIKVCDGANDGVHPPVLQSADMNSAAGTACSGCRVEIFSDPAQEAAVFEGFVLAGSDGRFSFRKPAGFANRNITSTGTDGDSTSALSKVLVVARPTMTPTLRPGETPRPTATFTPTEVPHWWIWLPWSARNAE